MQSILKIFPIFKNYRFCNICISLQKLPVLKRLCHLLGHNLFPRDFSCDEQLTNITTLVRTRTAGSWWTQTMLPIYTYHWLISRPNHLIERPKATSFDLKAKCTLRLIKGQIGPKAKSWFQWFQAKKGQNLISGPKGRIWFHGQIIYPTSTNSQRANRGRTDHLTWPKVISWPKKGPKMISRPKNLISLISWQNINLI